MLRLFGTHLLYPPFYEKESTVRYHTNKKGAVASSAPRFVQEKIIPELRLSPEALFRKLAGRWEVFRVARMLHKPVPAECMLSI